MKVFNKEGKVIIASLFSLLIFVGVLSSMGQKIPNLLTQQGFVPQEEAYKQASPSAIPSPTPSPTPRPLTFAQMNTLYGPCARVPTLLYHHVQNLDEAASKNQLNITVSPEYFRKQMAYLRDKGYEAINMQTLSNFFDQGIPLPAKPVLITFDDGYDDFASNAVPILNEFNTAATLFLSTGLADNPGYLSWATAQSVNSPGKIEIANHTWSHKSLRGQVEVIEREILTADTQLNQRGMNKSKVLAYPFGATSQHARTFLGKIGYKLAFTTKYGNTLCKKQRFDLPRLRVGNSELGNYGF